MIVACNIPNGVVLSIDAPHEEWEPAPGGARKVTVWRPTGRKIHLKGPHQGRRDLLSESPDVMASGYYLNQVADDLWTDWSEQKGKPPHVHSLLESRAVFAYSKIEGARARAREQRDEGVRSGLEPMGLGSDGVLDDLRARALSKKMSVTTADEQAHSPGAAPSLAPRR
jgi:hypothetical protein